MINIEATHKRAAELAIDHLVGLGHRRIALIKGQSVRILSRAGKPSTRRCQGQTQAQPGARVSTGRRPPTHDPGYFAAQGLLASKGAIHGNLRIQRRLQQLGAIRAMREAGLRVPQDVSVVGFDDVQSAAFQNPALTKSSPAAANHGDQAEAIIRQIASPSEHPPFTPDHRRPRTNRPGFHLPAIPKEIAKGTIRPGASPAKV